MKKHILLLFFLFTTVAWAKQPNVVLILSDDQSYTDYGFMGHPHIETPHLDKLASESALFPSRIRPDCPLPPFPRHLVYRSVFAPEQDHGK